MLRRTRYHRLAVGTLSCVLPLAGAGCAGNGLELKPAPATGASVSALTSALGTDVPGVSTVKPSPQAKAFQPSVPTPTIIAFRSATVVLYADDSGQTGQRISATDLSLPLPTLSEGTATRLDIMTEYGRRWLARADLLLAPSNGSANNAVLQQRAP
jgi:hypothetical protein